MAFISDEDLDKVRAASDLVSLASERIVVKQMGRKFKACCPFHDERTPSFQIDPELNLWHCFGCGEGGDVFDFVMRMENLEFPEAVRYLADRAGIELVEAQGGKSLPKGRKERLKACCEEAANFYHNELMRSKEAGASSARNYLAGRGFNSTVCKSWNLGYAPGRGRLVRHLRSKGFSEEEIESANLAYKNSSGRLSDRFYERVMFPIYDKVGACIAFGGRIIGKGEPKYLNTSETPIFHKSSNMFALNKAKTAISAQSAAVVVEGYTDVITLHEAGITNVVATLGTALTQQHVKMLRSLQPKKIIYLFDGDAAGQKAADRAVEFIDSGITPESGSSYLDFLVTVLPNNLDPAEYVAAYGKEALLAELDKAQPLIRFAIDRRLNAWDLKSPEQRNSALASAVSLLAPIKNSIIASDYANYIADRLGCDVSIAQRALAAAKPANPAVPEQNQGGSAPARSFSSVLETPSEKREREILSLCVAWPSLTEQLKLVSAQLSWSTDSVAHLASALCDCYTPGISPSDFVAKVDRTVSGAKSYLGASTLVCDTPDEAAATMKTMLLDLRELQLEESIRSGYALLKNEHNLDSDEYNKIFESVTTMQKDLNRLRTARAQAQS